MVARIMKEIDTNKVNVTFHKAFDQVHNIVESYDRLEQLGINRVLTQGGKQPIVQNFEVLK